MRTLLWLALTGLAGCSTIRSRVEIDPDTQFVLGGRQRGAFRVELLNTGATLIDVVEITAAADTMLVARLAPGDATEARIAGGSSARLVNRSAQAGRVQAVIRGDTGLGMRYVPAE